MSSLESLAPGLRLGIPELDTQHAYLVGRLERFDPELSAEATRGLLMELMRYTREHFRLEELFMERIRYPAAREHLGQHDDLLKHLVRFAGRDLRMVTTRRDFKAFLRDWLVEHIQTSDAGIAGFLQERDGRPDGVLTEAIAFPLRRVYPQEHESRDPPAPASSLSP